MADKIITFEYAYNNLAQFQLQPIPNTKKCMSLTDLDQYISFDPAPLAGYGANQLVPISKVIGVNTGMPDDLIYTIATSNASNSIGKSGIDESAQVSTASANGDLFSPLSIFNSENFYYNSLIVRKSATDPSLNKTFTLPAGKQPINYIINDIYEFFGASATTQSTLKRGELQQDGAGGDWGQKIMLNDLSGTSVAPSQFWIDAINTGVTFNDPLNANMGVLYYPTSQYQWMNPLNLISNIAMLYAVNYPNSPGHTDYCENFRRIIQPSQTPSGSGFWNVLYILKQLRCKFELRTPLGNQNFLIEYF